MKTPKDQLWAKSHQVAAVEYIFEKHGRDYAKEDHICYHVAPTRIAELMVGFLKEYADEFLEKDKEIARLTEIEECNKCTINNQRQEIEELKQSIDRKHRIAVDEKVMVEELLEALKEMMEYVAITDEHERDKYLKAKSILLKHQ